MKSTLNYLLISHYSVHLTCLLYHLQFRIIYMQYNRSPVFIFIHYYHTLSYFWMYHQFNYIATKCAFITVLRLYEDSVSKATAEGLHLLWQQRKGMSFAKLPANDSVTSKTFDQPEHLKYPSCPSNQVRVCPVTLL